MAFNTLLLFIAFTLSATATAQVDGSEPSVADNDPNASFQCGTGYRTYAVRTVPNSANFNGIRCVYLDPGVSAGTYLNNASHYEHVPYLVWYGETHYSAQRVERHLGFGRLRIQPDLRVRSVVSRIPIGEAAPLYNQNLTIRPNEDWSQVVVRGPGFSETWESAGPGQVLSFRRSPLTNYCGPHFRAYYVDVPSSTAGSGLRCISTHAEAQLGRSAAIWVGEGFWRNIESGSSFGYFHLGFVGYEEGVFDHLGIGLRDICGSSPCGVYHFTPDGLTRERCVRPGHSDCFSLSLPGLAEEIWRLIQPSR